MSKFIKQKKITPAQQLFAIKNAFPKRHDKIKKNVITWIGDIQPTPLSRVYTVRLTYKFDSKPSVFVLKPSLKELANNRKIPHLYSQEKEELCLFMSKYYDLDFR